MYLRKRILGLLMALVMMLGIVAMPALADGLKPGVYTETVKGFSDGLVVDVTINEKGIEKVEIKENNETAPGQPALEKMPGMIVDAQSVVIDGVAGATMTSNGIKLAVQQALEKAGANMEDFLKVPEKAEEKEDLPVMGSFALPEKWDESYDVVVVGGGFAGLAAAYAAVEQGARTLLVEKLSTTGGNSAINGGQYAAYTSKVAEGLQKEFNLVPDTAEKHIEDTIKGGDKMSKPALVKDMVYASPEYFNLLLDNGLKIRNVLARPGGHYGYRTYVTENQVGSDITNLQLEILKKTKAEIQLETKMVEIYRTRDEDNRVVGIRVKTPTGMKTIEAKKGVILATGGFSANVPMRETQVPYLTADLPTTNNPAASTGEGIYLAQAIGANTCQMSYIQRYPFANPENGVLDSYAVWPFTGPSYGIVYVDYQGLRYVNEGERRDVCANAAAGSGFISTYALFTKDVIGFTKPEELEKGIEVGRVLKGDTFEQLADAMNAFAIKGQFPKVTAENLKKTVEAHNSFIDEGVDKEFGKVMANTMVKMTEGPYYALPQFPSVHHTMGGLVIDETTKVHDIYGKVIPGLFAAGEVTGGVHGTNRLGSNADADACGIGYISGYYVVTETMPSFVPQN